MGYLYIFSTILFTVYGQLVLKWKINDYGSLPAAFLDKITFLMQLFLNPWILSCFLAGFLAALSWMSAMTKFGISYAYPFMSLSFVLVFIFSVFCFGDSFAIQKIAGRACIVLGIIIMK